ncbi:hypothetical protein MKZ38_010682 [Zalerion maritima]|uniref:Uncharacterized protein n=1 Tax=Zalerion maritima TaxID=339359 RepID=A0AAD5RT56_9PEZI|nr:hypothetical protein MKZ38_010682 [Zalerion maritima]
MNLVLDCPVLAPAHPSCAACGKHPACRLASRHVALYNAIVKHHPAFPAPRHEECHDDLASETGPVCPVAPRCNGYKDGSSGSDSGGGDADDHHGGCGKANAIAECFMREVGRNGWGGEKVPSSMDDEEEVREWTRIVVEKWHERNGGRGGGVQEEPDEYEEGGKGEENKYEDEEEEGEFVEITAAMIRAVYLLGKKDGEGDIRDGENQDDDSPEEGPRLNLDGEDEENQEEGRSEAPLSLNVEFTGTIMPYEVLNNVS